MTMRSLFVTLALGLLLAGCSGRGAPPAAPAVEDPPPSFVNKVWKVGQSSAVQAGQLYVFLSEGTLVIASSNGPPSLGKWRSDGDSLTMIEEGISHPVTVLNQTRDEFRISVRSAGPPVEITLVPALGTKQ
jgi:hypothetical protein